MVTFYLGCSFSFEKAVQNAGIPIRNIEQKCNVSMYKVGICTHIAFVLTLPVSICLCSHYVHIPVAQNQKFFFYLHSNFRRGLVLSAEKYRVKYGKPQCSAFLNFLQGQSAFLFIYGNKVFPCLLWQPFHLDSVQICLLHSNR